MQKLIEFYEMASLNDDALGENEQMVLMEARHALRLFARAMERLKDGPPEPVEMAIGFRLAA